jgi:hypothetical protein
MSKQPEAKPEHNQTAEDCYREAEARQNYQGKPIRHICSQCEHFRSEQCFVDAPHGYWERKLLRCSIGGFRVSRGGTCDRWQGKGAEEATKKPWDALL